MLSTELMIAVPLLLTLGVATYIDWRVQKVPNVLTFGGAVLALIMQWTFDGGSGLLLATTGWIVCLTCFLPLYIRGGMAAGDVKLMAAVGAFVGPVAGIVACLFSLIAGGVIAMASLLCLWTTRARNAERGATGSMPRDDLRKRIPYAGAIAVGTSFVLLVPAVIPPALAKFGV